MAVPSNYIDKITKGNDSRDICPAADKVRVNNENFEGTDLDGVLDEIAESISGAGGGTVKSVTVETPEDGTVDINVDDDTYTINLNHTHPQYLDIGDIDEYITAGSNVTITKDSQTGVLEISVSGGNVSSFTNDANYLKFQLCADKAEYDAIPTKDNGTLYLIPES